MRKGVLMHNQIEKVCKATLEQIVPKKSERARIEALAMTLEKKVASAAKAMGVDAVVRVEGSVAKDTWLSEEVDIDVFMRVPAAIPRNNLGEIGLKIARAATKGSKQVERFAEHPYLEAFVDGVRVNIVPCYNVKKREWLSATDRTPYHTDYIKEHLSAKMRDEVRLLKKFMIGIGVYGAEIKVGGFSGYLCELLILHYKSFVKTLEAFARYRQRVAVDIENYYKERENELQLLFREPLVIVDPVDAGRNVASAVQPHKLYTFVASARAFLAHASADFFFPPPTVALSVEALRQELIKRGSVIVFLAFRHVNVVPDILWGQLFKSQRSLNKLLQMNDFNVLRSLSWSDEKTLNVFLFELEQRFPSPVKKHLGPPLEKERESEKFLEKHLGNSGTVCGPYLEDGRWVVQQRRKFTDAVVLLKVELKDGGKKAGVAERIAWILRDEFKVFVNEEIAEVYAKNKAFAEFLTEFLSGKPKWLKAQLK
jgi:tRNA nucleotidyltransferase (CCA-adding enzyme)